MVLRIELRIIADDIRNIAIELWTLDFRADSPGDVRQQEPVCTHALPRPVPVSILGLLFSPSAFLCLFLSLLIPIGRRFMEFPEDTIPDIPGMHMFCTAFIHLTGPWKETGLGAIEPPKGWLWTILHLFDLHSTGHSIPLVPRPFHFTGYSSLFLAPGAIRASVRDPTFLFAQLDPPSRAGMFRWKALG